MAWVIRSAYDKLPQALRRELFFCLGEPQEGKSCWEEELSPLSVPNSSLTWGKEKEDKELCLGTEKLSLGFTTSGFCGSFSCCCCSCCCCRNEVVEEFSGGTSRASKSQFIRHPSES